tara:strand:+ start:72 stop:338 length:267 start_codon:yes stop_codon:yes gene_type:complete
MSDEHSVTVPVLNDDLTVMSFVVPKDFANQVELHACRLIEAFENHPAGEMDPNNKMMQAMSFVFQSALETYMDEIALDMEEHPPEISD